MEPSKTEWLYFSVYVSDDKDLNRWGADGWELVTILGTPGNMVKAYFKRKITK